MGKNLIGLAAGVAVAFATVLVVELIGHQIWPVAGEAALKNPEAPVQATSMPTGALLVVALAWFLAGLLGGFTARRLSGRAHMAWAVAAIVAAAAIVTVFMIPHPFWMQIMAVAAPLIGGSLAAHLGGARSDDAAA